MYEDLTIILNYKQKKNNNEKKTEQHRRLTMGECREAIEKTSFGLPMRENFLLDKETTFINHASYGSIPRVVADAQNRFRAEMLSCPDLWFRVKSVDYAKVTLTQMAEFVKAKAKNLVFLMNATTGVNTVLKSVILKPGDGVLATNLTYKAIANTCKHICNKVQGAEAHFLEITLPIKSEDEIVQIYSDYLTAHPNIKIAVIDHITSPTAIVMPIHRLIALCREHNVLSMIDGAHAPGQLPLNLEEINADFYTGNFHKWVYTPVSCALLWINPKHHETVEPLITSHCYKQGLHKSFFMQGTQDQTSYFSFCKAYSFYKNIGGLENIVSYTSSLVTEAALMLKDAWGTSLLAIPSSMEAPNMRLIKVPPLKDFTTSMDDSLKLILHLINNYKLVTVIVPVEDILYIRISSQIYNVIEDYQRIRDVILELRA